MKLRYCSIYDRHVFKLFLGTIIVLAFTWTSFSGEYFLIPPVTWGGGGGDRVFGCSTCPIVRKSFRP